MRALFIAFTAIITIFLGAEAQAQRVSVEIAPPVSRSEPQLAAYLRGALPAEIGKILRGKYTGPLRIRILDAKIMRQPGFGIAERADFLDGVVIVPKRDPILIRLTLPFERSLNAFTPQGESVRVQNLVQVFAHWVAKYL